MASRQQVKEKRAEAAARTAADELSDVNKERRERGVDEVTAKTAYDRGTTTTTGPGIPLIGGILNAVQGTIGHAKDVVTGKTHDTVTTTEDQTKMAAEAKDDASNRTWEAANRAGDYKDYTKDSAAQKAQEYKDYTADKAGEARDTAARKAREAADKAGDYKDYTSEKAREAADATAEKSRQATSKVGEYKDYAADKTKETKDSAMEKTKETKDSAMEKMGEYKDSAMEKARETKDAAADRAKQAKDATAGKLGEYKDYAVDKAKDTKDTIAQRARETGDATSQKAGEYKDYAADKAKEAKDTTMDKAGEYKDYTVEKAKEGKDATGGKLSELKDSAAGAARRAMDYLTGKKEQERKAEEAIPELKGKYEATEDEASMKMQELKLQEEGVRDEAKQRAEADRETAADRGMAGRSNIFNAIGSVTGSIKDKLTHPADIKAETEAARKQGGTKRDVERYKVEVEKSPVGEAASFLKNADQMSSSGQTFNDPRKMGEEGAGVVRVERLGRARNEK